jgi:hypothetical protein
MLAIPGSIVGAVTSGLLFSVIDEEKLFKSAGLGWPPTVVYLISEISKILN